MAILPEDDDFHNWSTSQITVTTIRPRKTVAVPRDGDGVSLGDGVVLQPHPNLGATVRLTTVKLALKYLGEQNLPAFLQENSNQTQFFQFALGREGNSKLNVLQLKDINIDTIQSVTYETPLKLATKKPLEQGEKLLVIAYNGEYFLPLDIAKINLNIFTFPSSQVFANTIELTRLPYPANYEGSLYILFKQFISEVKSREIENIPTIGVADVEDDNIVIYENDINVIKQRVAAANNIIICIHGVISDTKSMLLGMQQKKVEVNGTQKSIVEFYDLALTFDYGSQNTSINENVRILKHQLESVGLGANHDKQLDIIAHSTGGLIARWFIEREEGNKVVQNLIMLGTPNAGCVWANIKDAAKLFFAIGLNNLSDISWDTEIFTNLISVIENSDFSLDGISPDSDFINALAASPDPGIPYIIIAGNSSIIPTALQPQVEENTPLEKLTQSLFGTEFTDDLSFFAQPNDLFATVESIKSIPQEWAPQQIFIEVNCNHFNYFYSPEVLNILAKTLVQKENKQPTHDFEVVHKIEAHKGGVSSVKFSPNGQMIASAGADKLIKIWSLDGTCVATLEGHEKRVIEVAFSPDGQYLVSGGDDKTVRLWNLQDNQISLIFQGHRSNVNSVAFSMDGQIIASGGWDRNLHFWDLQGHLIFLFSSFTEENKINSVAFCPDGEHIAVSCEDGNIKYLNLVKDSQPTASFEKEFSVHTSAVNSIAFSPDGQLLASASDDGTIRLWDLKAVPTISQPITGHENSVRSVTFSPDGNFIISSSRDNTIRLWDLQGNQIAEPLMIHSDSVTSMAISGDGQMIVSGSNDGTICLLRQKQALELDKVPEVVKTYAFYPTLETLTPELSVAENCVLTLNLTGAPQSGVSPLRIPVNTLEITVYIEAPGFYLRDEHTRTLPVQKGKLMEENSLSFQLTPLISGCHSVKVSVYPGGRLPNLSPVKLIKELNVNSLKVLPNIRELIDRRAIPDPQPDIVLYVTLEEEVADAQTTQQVGLYLTCAALEMDRKRLEPPLQFNTNELERLREYVIQEAVIVNGSPVDNLTSLRLLGEMLFNRLIPPENQFREDLCQLINLANNSEHPLSLLIISESKAILPWELVCAVYQLDTGEIYYEFLGQKFILAHWVGSQGLKLANEAPLDQLGLTHYNRPEEQAYLPRWSAVLGDEVQLSGESRIVELMRPGSRCYGLHVLRYTNTQQTGEITSIDENQQLSTGKTPTQAEGLLYNQQLDFTLRRPVVALSLIDGQPLKTAMSIFKRDNQIENNWMQPMLHAGATAVVGTRWTVQAEADQLFYRVFYQHIRSGKEFGWAVWRAREEVRLVFPHRSDWLAYTYFGHPKCEPYLVRASQGFTFFEALKPPENDCFEAGQSYKFRASYRTEAPVWYKGRLHAPQDFVGEEDLSVTVMSTRGISPETYPLELVENGDCYQCIVTLTIPAKVSKKLPLVVYFQQGEEELHSLILNLKVVAGGKK